MCPVDFYTKKIWEGSPANDRWLEMSLTRAAVAQVLSLNAVSSVSCCISVGLNSNCLWIPGHWYSFGGFQVMHPPTTSNHPQTGESCASLLGHKSPESVNTLWKKLFNSLKSMGSPLVFGLNLHIRISGRIYTIRLYCMPYALLVRIGEIMELLWRTHTHVHNTHIHKQRHDVTCN